MDKYDKWSLWNIQTIYGRSKSVSVFLKENEQITGII